MNFFKIILTLLIFPLVLFFYIIEIIVLTIYNVFLFLKEDVFISYIINENPLKFSNVRNIFYKPLICFYGKIDIFLFKKFKRR